MFDPAASSLQWTEITGTGYEQDLLNMYDLYDTPVEEQRRKLASASKHS